MNYPKIAKKLKKEFPDLTEEQISQMIFQIPPNLPYPILVMSIKLTKASIKNPQFLDKLKVNEVTEADFEVLKQVEDLEGVTDGKE